MTFVAGDRIAEAPDGVNTVRRDNFSAADGTRRQLYVGLVNYIITCRDTVWRDMKLVNTTRGVCLKAMGREE